MGRPTEAAHGAANRDGKQARLTGRRLLGAALAMSLIVVTACGGGTASPSTVSPSTAATAAASTAGSSAPAASASGTVTNPAAMALGLKGSWDEIVAAAKQEKTLNLWVHNGTGYEAFAAAAQKALPELDIHVTAAGGGDQAPIVAAEQQGGVYNWDIVMAGNSGIATTLNPIGAIVPIRPFFDALPAGLTNDADWSDGFHVYANPDELNWVINYQLNGGLWVNSKLTDIKTADDLLNPKYTGKIVIHDPGNPSTGSGSLATMLVLKGEDYVRKILKDQKPIIVDSAAAVFAALEDGRALIGIGANSTLYKKMLADGLGKDIVEIDKLDLFMYPNIYAMSIFKNLPHPNATALFMSWAISQEGMKAWATLTLTNASTRRFGTGGGGRVLTPAELAGFPAIGGTYKGTEITKKVYAIFNE